jgi:sorting nexin-1/2
VMPSSAPVTIPLVNLTAWYIINPAAQSTSGLVPTSAHINMSSGVSPSLGSLDLDSSPWGEERSENTVSLPPPSIPLSLPVDDGFKDAAAGTQNDDGSSQNPVPRPARRPVRRPARQVVRAEVIDDDLGPLGPLGDSLNESSEPSTPQPSMGSGGGPEVPPQPPIKESSPHALRVGGSPTIPTRGAIRDVMDHAALGEGDDDYASQGMQIGGTLSGLMHSQRGGETAPPTELQPPPVKPVFEISVGDPHKVGDITSAHTVYQVRTRVRVTVFCAYYFNRCVGAD